MLTKTRSAAAATILCLLVGSPLAAGAAEGSTAAGAGKPRIERQLRQLSKQVRKLRRQVTRLAKASPVPGPRGPAGPAGPAGAGGNAGPRGPSDAFSDEPAGSTTIGIPGTPVATLSLPAGSYVLTGRFVANNQAAADPGEGDCSLYAGATEIDQVSFDLVAAGADNEETITLHAARTFGAPTTVQAVCQDLTADDVRIASRRLTAIRVQTLTAQ